LRGRHLAELEMREIGLPQILVRRLAVRHDDSVAYQPRLDETCAEKP
jgi:hypothetical protein